MLFRVRELTTAKIGTLLKITAQVVRTHPVHPELVSGTFMCLDCRTIIKDVEQQFKYTQVGIVSLFISVLAIFQKVPDYSDVFCYCSEIQVHMILTMLFF